MSGLEIAAYTNAAGEERIWQAFGGAAVRRRRGGLGGSLAAVPQARPGRQPLDRPAVGGAGRGRDRGRDRPGPRLRHRRTPDDAALSRAARGRGAEQRARHRLRLGRAVDRGSEARVRSCAGVRLRPAGGRGERAERSRQRRLDRRPPGRPASRTTCRRPTSRSRTSPPRRCWRSRHGCGRHA